MTKTEETYLIRFLFVTNRYEELWGYIADVGVKKDTEVDEEENIELDAELVAIKSSWYFKNLDKVSSDLEDMKILLEQVEQKLNSEIEIEDRELFQLAQALLRNCLGEEEFSDIDIQESENISDIQYIFLATNAFNGGKYNLAIDYCQRFFDVEKNSKETKSKDVLSLQQLEPQEQMTLHYYIQLIFAHAHFEYAKGLRKGSEMWKTYMEIAEQECAVFEQSSKSLFYIGEQFRILKNSIDIENGKLPENLDETGKAVVETI